MKCVDWCGKQCGKHYIKKIKKIVEKKAKNLSKSAYIHFYRRIIHFFKNLL